jgi:predicted outer membrane repeat protein
VRSDAHCFRPRRPRSLLRARNYCRTGANLLGSTVTGNSAGTDGGGIFNGGTLTLINSTVSGNTATTDGGGSLIVIALRLSYLAARLRITKPMRTLTARGPGAASLIQGVVSHSRTRLSLRTLKPSFCQDSIRGLLPKETVQARLRRMVTTCSGL